VRPPLAITAALLVLAACAPTAHAYRFDGPRWPGSTITYFNATGYKTAVSAAVRTWNASGVAVRFRAVSRRKARVLITGGYGRGCRGVARVGFFRSSRALVRLGSGCELESSMTQVAAHELGHVLGLGHDNRRCALMNSSGASRCETEPDWQYRCRVLERDDVLGAVRRYGGTVRAVREQPFCPVFAPPAAPSGVALAYVSGAVGAGLTITEPEHFVRDLRQIIFVDLVVYRHANACPAAPGEGPPLQTLDAEYGPQLTTLDYNYQPGAWCYAVAVQDASGRRGPFATASIVVPPPPLP